MIHSNNNSITASRRKRKSKPDAEEVKEHGFGSSRDDKDEDIRVPDLPPASPTPFRGGENKEDHSNCDRVGRVFEGAYFV